MGTRLVIMQLFCGQKHQETITQQLRLVHYHIWYIKDRLGQ